MLQTVAAAHRLLHLMFQHQAQKPASVGPKAQWSSTHTGSWSERRAVTATGVPQQMNCTHGPHKWPPFNWNPSLLHPAQAVQHTSDSPSGKWGQCKGQAASLSYRIKCWSFLTISVVSQHPLTEALRTQNLMEDFRKPSSLTSWLQLAPLRREQEKKTGWLFS